MNHVCSAGYSWGYSPVPATGIINVDGCILQVCHPIRYAGGRHVSGYHHRNRRRNRVRQDNIGAHRGLEESILEEPRHVIIVEGILLFENPEVRNLLDIKIYVDTDADIRFARRLIRDIHERGRDIDSVVNQYLHTVKPMHEAFVEPTKRHADIIVPEGGMNEVATDMIVEKIKSVLRACKEITCSMNFKKQRPNSPFFFEKEQVISLRRLRVCKEITCSMNFKKQRPDSPFFFEKEQVISL